MPLSFDGTLLVVVVALLEMSLGVSLPAGHCANRKHRATLWLFEGRDQEEGRRMRENSRVCFLTVASAYACSMAVDFARLLSRICSVVNPPPQTLQRQLGGAACAITGAGCRSECLALTSSLPQCGQSRRIIRSADKTSLAPR